MDTAGSNATPPPGDPRRWRVLALLAGLQFMLVLDITVVNVALPSVAQSLGFSQSGLAWVVNGYVLMAGGLLLLGGRLADVFGRRRLLLLGAGLFAAASAVCGAAQAPWMLVAGRFVQGLGEAFAAPAALGLIALLFVDPRERTKALGIWGGLTGLGGTLGFVMSGVLTDAVSWRWIFYVNVPVAVLILVVAPRIVTDDRKPRPKEGRLDFTGAVTATAGLVAIVYGLLQAAARPWGATEVLLPVIAGACLLGVTVVVELKSRNPLIPLRFFADRTRTTINIATLGFMAAFVSYTFLLTLFEQQVLGYSPLRTGLLYLPLGVAIGAGIALCTTLMPRFGVRAMASAGYLGAGIGLLLTSMIDADSGYGRILPGMLVFGLFAGITMPAGATAALHQVTERDSSLASGVQSTMQQVGSALGLACLVTLALRHAGGRMRENVLPSIATTEGYALSFRIGAALLVAGGLSVMLMMERVVPSASDPIAASAVAGNQSDVAAPGRRDG
ncbi:MFS transporter [Amycolatopsis sp. CA-230715]|uniref:MFS transporter n=1 Tax=Amycolatopsis sp. CA-230715 TaxID=2745196 RepID=UPI001C02EB50|nr:MFS transporter [Amycolatopsis sp. CA-230715]QWF82538.1 Putative multidrug resistance protein MdtD [Amycolatopsis sp. CA-230715]